MYAKALFCIIDVLAIIVLMMTVRLTRTHVREKYGLWLNMALNMCVIAIISNIMIALSVGKGMANVSYSFYFAAIDWIIFFLFGFCLIYTDHENALYRLRPAMACLMGIDNVMILSNIAFERVYEVYGTTNASGVTFYQTFFHHPYYVHLAIDYVTVLVSLLFIIHGMRQSVSIYRLKYLMILLVLTLVIVLNLIYMTFGLVLDVSVVFYAVAGILIFFSIHVFVPRSLLIVSTGRAVDEMREGLLLFDLGEKCIYANAFAKNRFEVVPDEYNLESMPVSLVIKSLRERGQEYGEYDYRRPSDEEPDLTEHYNFKYDVLTDKQGRTVGSYFLIVDRTEAESYLSEIRKARDEADRANRAKTVFLANMSHEIRTPLNSVLGMNEMILRSTNDPRLIEYAENIRTSGDTLLGLINDILDFSKIEAGKLEIIQEEYDPYEMLVNASKAFGQMAFEKKLFLKFEADANMPTKLCGDYRHINEVLSNIISNAIKYTHEGGVKASMHAEPITDETDRVMLIIDISDTGIGIDEDDIKYLFDSFKRVNESQNASIQGTGLGLAITKNLVEALDGTIDVSSDPGSGSTFRVALPQSVRDGSPHGPLNLDVRQSPAAAYHESFHAPGTRVLVVDDSAMNLKVIRALLKKTEMNIDTASSADQAIDMCMETKYDLVLLDHRMPIKDGVEAFKEISSEGMNVSTPVIMLTANALAGAEEEYVKMGFAGYLSKPVRGYELENMMIRILPEDKYELT